MSNWRKFWNLFSADCTSCLWLLREDGNAVSGVQLRTMHLNSSTYCCPHTASRAFWISLGHPAGPSAPAAEGFGSPAGLAVTHGSSVWKSEIHRGILNSTSCWHVSAAFISCPHSLAVGIWTIVSQTDFDMQTSICRCLPPSLYAIEGERFMSRGCLDIPRAGPSCDVLYTAHFSTDTLGGLTAVHKFRVRPRDWEEGGERGHRPLPCDGQTLQAVLGLCTCPWSAPLSAPLRGAAAGAGGSTASSACQETNTQTTDTLQHRWGWACPLPLVGVSTSERSLQSHGHGQTAFLKQHSDSGCGIAGWLSLRMHGRKKGMTQQLTSIMNLSFVSENKCRTFFSTVLPFFQQRRN